MRKLHLGIILPVPAPGPSSASPSSPLPLTTRSLSRGTVNMTCTTRRSTAASTSHSSSPRTAQSSALRAADRSWLSTGPRLDPAPAPAPPATPQSAAPCLRCQQAVVPVLLADDTARRGVRPSRSDTAWLLLGDDDLVPRSVLLPSESLRSDAALVAPPKGRARRIDPIHPLPRAALLLRLPAALALSGHGRSVSPSACRRAKDVRASMDEAWSWVLGIVVADTGLEPTMAAARCTGLPDRDA